MTASAAERKATVITAIAKALIETANDFGEGNQIAGDCFTLAGAAWEAAVPLIRQFAVDHVRRCEADCLHGFDELLGG